jgi:hypothetical protein
MHYLEFWPHLKTFMLRERWHLTVSDFEQLEQKESISSLKDLAKLDGKIIQSQVDEHKYFRYRASL